MSELLNKIGGFESEFGAEIAVYDAALESLFVVSGGAEVQVLDLSDPTNPVESTVVDLTTLIPDADGANSIAVKNGILAIAVELDNGTDDDVVALIDLEQFVSGSITDIQLVPVGSLPDMLTFTEDGSEVLVANEGEPDDDYVIDPVGSVSIIDVSGGIGQASVATAGFESFNDQKDALIAEGVRIFGPNASVAQDLEPEYIAISGDDSTAFVTLQENNAIAIVDIATATVTDIVPLGAKDFSLPGNQLDASNEDGPDGEGAINILNWPVFGLYQPDAIASYQVNGATYYVTANEGDARDYDGFSEEARVKDLGDPEEGLGPLDPDAFPNAEELQDDANLGRLKITTTLGDIDGDGDFDQLWGYGARSFSIWDSTGNLVFDSGDDFANITAEQVPELFNSQGDADSFDSRSDDKGAEPETVTIGEVDGKTLAFIGLERIGGVMVYDVSNPTAPEFVEYQPNAEGDVAPEGLLFIPAAESPNGEDLLISANEVSETIAVYQVGGFVIPEGAIVGTDGDDTIEGTGSDDVIVGGAGNDRLLGGNGDDTFDGGVGDDRYIGDKGADIFVLRPGEGVDTIRDFRLWQGDKIALVGGLSFGDLTISRFGKDGARLSVGGEDLAIVQSTRFGAINQEAAFIEI